MRNLFAVPLLAILVFIFPGCDSGGGNGPAGGGSGLTAKVDGQGWEAEPLSIVAQANAGVAGSVMILGSQTVDGKTKGLTITVYNVGGPGQYALGASSTVFGGIGQWGEGTGSGGNANSWITPESGVAGTIDIQSVDGGRIVGTFSYVAGPGKNNAVGGDRAITEGRFDLPLKGTVTPLAEGVGSKVAAELNGAPYYAADAYGSLTDFTGGPGITISSVSSLQTLNITLVGVTAPGTYTYSNTAPQRLITAGRNGGTAANCCWGVNAPGDVDEIIVTSLTAKRIKGTFTATLKPQPGKPATQDLVITNGTFDIGIP